MMWILVLFSVLFVYTLLYFLNIKIPGSGSQKLKTSNNNVKFYLKYSVAYGLLFFKQIVNLWIRRCSSKYKNESEDLDKVQILANNPMAFDAVFFAAASKDGIFIIAGCERRHNTAYCIFYLLVPEIGLLYNDLLPYTKMQLNEDCRVFGSTNFYLQPLEIMKKWRLHYDGKMRVNKSDEILHVTVDCIWTSEFKFILLDKEGIHIRAIARALASQLWTKKYFQTLKRSHSIRYEQFGQLEGMVKIVERNLRFKIDATSFRDHNFGDERNWHSLYRYSYFIIFLSNSTNIVIGIICNPETFSRLEIGFVCQTDRTCNAIQYVNFFLENFGEHEPPPTECEFDFKAGKTAYHLSGKAIAEHHNYKGPNSEALIIDRFCKFNVNGIPGFGIWELHFNLNFFKHIKF